MTARTFNLLFCSICSCAICCAAALVHPTRVSRIDGIIADIGVEVELVLISNGVGLQERSGSERIRGMGSPATPKRGGVYPCLVSSPAFPAGKPARRIHAKVGQPCLAGILEPPHIRCVGNTPIVIPVDRPPRAQAVALDRDGARLVEKRAANAEAGTRFEWNARGLLAAVILPDGTRVENVYDTYARRVAKRVVPRRGPARGSSTPTSRAPASVTPRGSWRRVCSSCEPRPGGAAGGPPTARSRGSASRCSCLHSTRFARAPPSPRCCAR